MDEPCRTQAPAPLPDSSPDGVDLTLIRAFLTLTPAQRLEFLDDRSADLARIRRRQLGDALGAGGRPLPGSEARPQPDQREGGSSKRWPSHERNGGR